MLKINRYMYLAQFYSEQFGPENRPPSKLKNKWGLFSDSNCYDAQGASYGEHVVQNI